MREGENGILQVHVFPYPFIAETIVGVNKYRLEKEVPVEVLSIDNSKVIAVQKAKIAKIHSTRDKKAVEEALNALTDCASGAGECKATAQ